MRRGLYCGIAALVLSANLAGALAADAEALIRAREATGAPLRQLRLMRHSHISETYAVGTADASLSTPVLKFIRESPAAR